VRARLAIIAAVGGLALAAAPKALADPIPVAPADAAEFTARVGQIPFQATVDALTPPAFPAQMEFRVSRSQTLSNANIFSAGADLSVPPVYQGGPDSDANWPNRPGTYYWQARYDDCALADPLCVSPIRSLTIAPLAPPTHRFPADDATIRYGGEPTFSVQDIPSYERSGTRIEIEFSRSANLSPDGTFADPERVVRPAAVGGGVYRHRLGQSISEAPGTYYWIVERFDCFAPDGPADCYVTDGEVRSFTVNPPVTVNPPAPDTTLTRHPPRRTRKRRAKFAFVSDLPDASFECYYTGGWAECVSPQKFRRLKRGRRYRFKVRAVANGEHDETPASWLFKVRRRR
jgi:hypothetical protein